MLRLPRGEAGSRAFNSGSGSSDGERRPAREAELTDLTMGHGVFWGLDAIF